MCDIHTLQTVATETLKIQTFIVKPYILPEHSWHGIATETAGANRMILALWLTVYGLSSRIPIASR